MNILAFDTSTSEATVSIMKNNELVCEYNVTTNKTHSKMLMPMIDEALKNVDMNLDEINKILVCKGPGSFTGLRIGITTANMFAKTLNKDVYGISSIDSLANNVEYSDCYICPIIDAKRKEVYTAIYEMKNGKIIKIEEDKLIKVDSLLKSLKRKRKQIVFVGDAVKIYEKVIKDEIKNSIFLEDRLNKNRASSLIRQYVNNEKSYVATDYISPYYIRKSQAEEQLDAKKS